jgi:asparaginyl-tRNA synthetase
MNAKISKEQLEQTGTGRHQGWVERIAASDLAGWQCLTVRGGGRTRDCLVPDALVRELDLTPQSVVRFDAVIDPAIGRPVATDVELINRALPLPTSIAEPDLFDLKHRHLHLRSAPLRAVAQFRHFIQKYARDYLDGHGCYSVQTPILTEASCVCSGDVFTFPYYGKRIATLIQSPWMYADALTSGVERVYALNPSFRRERNETNIHLVEIWQLQVDLAWASNDDIMALEQGLVQHIATRLRAQHQDLYELAGLSSSHLDAFTRDFVRISYDESLERLKALGHDLPYGSDYTQAQSDALSRSFDRPYFITQFPKQLKNFWFPQLGKDTDLTPSNDLFAHTGQGEIIGGGERVHDLEQLIANLHYYEHDLDEFDWFVDIRRYGCVPHAGFSVGFDRLVAMLMGVQDIRKATLIPRIPNGPLKP